MALDSTSGGSRGLLSCSVLVVFFFFFFFKAILLKNVLDEALKIINFY